MGTQNPPRFGCRRREYRGQHHLLLHTQSADELFKYDVEGAEEESAKEQKDGDDCCRAQDVQGTEAQTAQKGVGAEELADVKWKRKKKQIIDETFSVNKEKERRNADGGNQKGGSHYNSSCKRSGIALSSRAVMWSELFAIVFNSNCLQPNEIKVAAACKK